MMMKRFLMLVLAFGLLVGCEAVEESGKAVDGSKNQGEAIEIRTIKRSTDVDEYLVYMNEYGERFHQLNNDLHKHYIEAQESPAIIFTSAWKEELEDYLKNASGIYVTTKQRRLDMKVPEQFVEIHELNEGAYELTKFSIEKSIEALETGDKEALELSLFYQDMSTEKIRQSTELINEMLNK